MVRVSTLCISLLLIRLCNRFLGCLKASKMADLVIGLLMPVIGTSHEIAIGEHQCRYGPATIWKKYVTTLYTAQFVTNR